GPFRTTASRHPEQPIEAPMAIGAMSCRVRTTKRRSPLLAPGVTDVISPMSVTLPVNMTLYLCPSRPASPRVALQRAGRTQPEPGPEIQPIEAQLADRRAAI